MNGKQFWLMVLGWGALIAAVLAGFELLRYSYLLRDWSIEWYIVRTGVPILVAGILLGRWIGHKRQPKTASAYQPPDNPLTDRELEVLTRVADGLSNQEVADQLFVSLNTVKTHLQSIYGKLGVKRRTQAVAAARELRLIRSGVDAAKR